MPKRVIKDWTERLVALERGMKHTVRYQVYEDGARTLQKIHDGNSVTIRTLELPGSGKLDQGSYEVLLRYALRGIVKP